MKYSKNNLDLMSTKKLVELFLNEEQKAIDKLKTQKIYLTQAINLITNKIKKNGRMIYVGAGTSGRLGILDTVECKPTFSTNSFLGVMAGGKNAFLKAKEGTEDDTNQAVKDLKKLKVTTNDLVIGISASGETPYTIAAIKYVKRKHIKTISITSNPKSSLSKLSSLSISPALGGEIIAGSTRLKSGTSQKIILNILSSVSMIKSGKVYKNLMVDVQPTNKKLMKRAIGIISIICEVPLNKARVLFTKAKRSPKAAIVMHCKNCDLTKAESLLKKANYNLRKIIG